MAKEKQPKRKKPRPPAQRVKPVSRGRHAAGCKICSHPKLEEIERQFVDWGNTTRIAKEYGLTRDSVYRHAHATGLFVRRQRNIRAALERIIEKSEGVEVTASAVVSAIQAHAKINASGKWVDRVETVNVNKLFEQMSQEELEKYARNGTLPAWFTKAVVATPLDGQEREIDS